MASDDAASRIEVARQWHNGWSHAQLLLAVFGSRFRQLVGLGGACVENERQHAAFSCVTAPLHSFRTHPHQVQPCREAKRLKQKEKIREFLTKKGKDETSGRLSFLPSSKLIAPAKTRAANSPTEKPATPMHCSTAYRNKGTFSLSLIKKSLQNYYYLEK